MSDAQRNPKQQTERKFDTRCSRYDHFLPKNCQKNDPEIGPKMTGFPDLGQNGAELNEIVGGIKDAPYFLKSKSRNRTEI